MYATILLAVTLAPDPNELSAAALKDAEQFRLPSGELSPYYYYLVADPTTNGVLRWVLSSTSLQVEVEQCLPVPIAPNLYRIYLGTPQNEEQTVFDGGLGWRHEDWRQVLSTHPYGGYSMLVRGDWLLTDILDAALSASQHADGIPSYYRLLYRGKPPQNEQELLTFWEIDDVQQRHRGAIEGVSQVNRRGRRWIERRSRHDGYFWITRDSTALAVGSDPLEDPSGGFKHDGSEAIIGVNKTSSTGFSLGAVQYYWLGNGSGTTVFEAPVQLVEDATRFRNVASIRTWGSCLQCHVEGIRPLDENVLLSLNDKYGIWTVPADGKSNQVLDDIRRFHFGDLSREIRRNQEDYAAGVEMHTGWTVKELIEAAESVIRGYDAPLTLAKGAVELGTTAEVLQTAITEYSSLKEGGVAFSAPVGLLMMARGGTASRDLYAQQFSFLDQLVRQGGGHDGTTRPAGLPVNPPDRTDSDNSASTKPAADANRAVPTRRRNVIQRRPRR